MVPKRISIQEAIREALLELLHKQTIDSISVAQIIQIAGVSKRSFYNYYDDKFDVCNNIYDHMIEEQCWFSNASQIPASLGDYFDHLHALVHGTYAYFYEKCYIYHGQNCIHEHVIKRGTLDLERCLFWTDHNDLITPNNILLLEFYMRGLDSALDDNITNFNHSLKSNESNNQFLVKSTDFIPASLHDVLMQQPIPSLVEAAKKLPRYRPLFYVDERHSLD